MGPPDTGHPGPQGRDLAADDSALGVVRRIEASLAAAGFKVTRDSVAGRQAVIARSSRSGRRRQTFVLVAVFKDCTSEHLDRFLDEAGQYAATVKGALRTAVAVAVAVCESVEAAWGWADRVGERSFPVLVDVGSSSVAHSRGAAEVARIVEGHVDPALR